MLEKEPVWYLVSSLFLGQGGKARASAMLGIEAVYSMARTHSYFQFFALKSEVQQIS